MFVFAIIFAIFALIAIPVAKAIYESIRRDESRRGKNPDLVPKAFKIVPPVALALLSAMFLMFASTTIVSTKNVGVVTTFGRPTASLSNGLHLKAPWSKVTELDGAVQIDTQTSDVRLGNNSMAGVENSVQWRITSDRADELFLDYRTFDSIRDNLVIRQLNAALNDVFASYNPLAPENAGSDEGPNLNELSKQVADNLRKRIDSKVEIIGVIIPVVRFDEQTQQKLDAYQQEIGNTRIAQQKKETATAEALANKELSASISNDPNVLVSKCLDIVKASGQSPLGCWGGTTTIVPTR